MSLTTLIALTLTAQAATPTPAPSPASGAQAAAAAKIQSSAQAFSGCIQAKITAVPASLTPEQGADHVLAACKAEQTALESSVNTVIAAAPPEQQAAARKQMADSMAMGRNQIVEGLRQMRAAPAAPATPTAPAAPKK